MSLISLKNVSKFYYSKGVIASGFTKVNLELNNAEFVAITGESGSGKSTLLNVISGLDSYEEGEMYINGEETSHYTEKDFEDYRRKYIGNIFQTFNLVNSYTVYQNIELSLLLNGCKKKQVKKEIIDLIKKVGLYKFRNTKVSKLSGGMKQRVAIARAIAKETPIIIADEPTGNLDSKAAKDVIKLLSEVAKDKLVIIVTHNYEQIENYVTRKITMHDGKITEDKKIIDKKNSTDIKASNYKNVTFFNKLRLGIRNAFNIKVKFLLLLFVYAFSLFALCFEYTSFKEDEYVFEKSGSNNYFYDTNDKRLILTKKNREMFTDDDYEIISKVSNLDHITKYDTLNDKTISFTDPKEEAYIFGLAKDIDTFNGKLDVGRMPENDHEIAVLASTYDYYLKDNTDDALKKDFYRSDLKNIEFSSTPYKVVGIKFSDNAINDNNDSIFYFTKDAFTSIAREELDRVSKTKIMFNDIYIDSPYYETDRRVFPSNKVKDGQVILSDLHHQYCKNYNCRNKKIKINVKNAYYEDEITLKVSNIYNKRNFKKLTGFSNYDYSNGIIVVSFNDYNRLYNKGIYQSSVFVKDINKIEDTITDLKKFGYNVFSVQEHLVTYEPLQILQILKTVVTIILIIVLFVISYFVTKIILKSRQVYFSTIRMLGSTKKICKNLLTIELLVVSNIAFIIFMTSLYLTKINVIEFGAFKMILRYFGIFEIILSYVVINAMSYIISKKYSKKLFKNSVVSTLKEVL